MDAKAGSTMIAIRHYGQDDRAAVRRISCETSFLEYPRKSLFDDDEILADALTLYFTDHEPGSCFVAVADDKVVGYIIGSLDVKMMNRVTGSEIILPLLKKAFRRGVFGRMVNLRFFYFILRSVLKKEFAMPDFSEDYPATLHINLDKAYRGQGVGERLIGTYLAFLKDRKTRGVHFGTFSEGAKSFFSKQSFNLLFQSKRTYLKPYLSKDINFYLFGKQLLVSLFFILMCGFAMPRPGGTCLAQEAPPAPAFESVRLAPEDRVLIMAPHPDDEVLGCAGIIQKALALKLPVKVVFLTYGDNNEWSFLIYRKYPVIFPWFVKRMGMVRHDEALAADASLGLSPEQLIFLGYPDFSTMDIWYKHWGKRPALLSMLTRVRAVPYNDAFRPQAPYKGEEVLKDLASIFAEFKPTKIFLSHPADHNGDHRSLYLFATVALWELKMDNVALFPYLVHHASWPLPRGYHPQVKLNPPEPYKQEIPWRISPLDLDEIKRKETALKKHHSQFESSPAYLQAFVKENELFGDFPLKRLEAREGSLSLISDAKEENDSLGEELNETVYVAEGRMVITVRLSRKIGREQGVSLYLFGYRQDVPFEKMPKLHVQFGALFHHIHDQNRNIDEREAGILVKREGDRMVISIPLAVLGSPSRILFSATKYFGNIPLNWVSWRTVELP